MRLAFVVLGEPVGKGRGRAFINPGTGRPDIHTPRKTENYEQTVADLALYQGALAQWPKVYDGIVAVTIDAVFTRPQNRYRKADPTCRIPRESGRIDCDNVAKAILDGLQAGAAIRNDSKVVDLHVRLWWTAVDEGPCVEVEVTACKVAA